MTPEWREFWRWTICGVIVLGVHAGAAAAVIYWPEKPPTAEPSAALVLEMAALPAAPAVPETEKPPAPVEEEVTNDTPPDPVIEEAKVEPEPDVVPPVEETPPEPQVEPPPEPPPPEITQAVKPEVAIAMPEKPKPPEKKKQPPRKQAAAPKPIQSARVAPAAAPSQGLPTISDSNAVPDWRSRVSGQMERNKRRPSSAERGDSGYPKIRFTLDRRGNVVSVQLLSSSGSSVFDQEALALPRRAAPFPPPPPELSDAQLSLSVTVNFNR